jgi:DNA-binding MarR family transcriptional regulator
MSLRDAYWALHRRTDQALQPLGVTANQFVVLSLLAAQDGVSQQDLVARASSDPNTIRAMLLALVRKGLVERRDDPDDGRAWSVTLSARGRRAQRRLWAMSEDLRGRLLEALRPGEAELLADMLGRVAAAMSPRARPRMRAAGAGATA